MDISIIHHHYYGVGAKQLRAIHRQLENIMTKLDDATVALQTAATELTALKTQGEKVSTEIEALLQKIADLTAIIEAGGAGETTPEFDAALAAMQAGVAGVKTALQAADDKNPDAPPEPV